MKRDVHPFLISLFKLTPSATHEAKARNDFNTLYCDRVPDQAH